MPLGLFAAVCAVAAEFGYRVSVVVDGESLPIVWPLLGIMTAVLLISERRRWPLLLLTAAGTTLGVGSLLHGRSPLVVVAFAVIPALEAAAAARLLQWMSSGSYTLARVANAWALALASATVPFVGGAAAALLLYYSADHTPFLNAWRAWWLAGGLGLLLGTPLAFAGMTGSTVFAGPLRPWRIFEACVVMLGAIVVAESVFGDWLPLAVRVPAYMLPLLLWAAFRFELGDTAAVMFIVCAIGAWNTAHMRGPFANLDPSLPVSSWVLRSQGAMAAASLSILLLASIIAERRRASAERAVLLGELQQALAEIKTLQGMIPICAWCHKIRNDAGFWQGIESYLQAHTDATFSHGICPDCAHDVGPQVTSSAAEHR
jgi:integral membrane sensor domain MASE1